VHIAQPYYILSATLPITKKRNYQLKTKRYNIDLHDASVNFPAATLYSRLLTTVPNLYKIKIDPKPAETFGTPLHETIVLVPIRL
jgi:hypothetical protein